jgi:DNA primase
VPGIIPEPVLEQIRQNNDIVEVIGSYFPLKRAGANFRALCPFHKEKTPSFNVNPQKQIWHCFGCGAGGDVFTFVMKYENLDFVAAVRRLAERAGIKLEYEERAGEPGRDQKESLLKLHDLAANFFHHNLMKERSATVAREYLKKRQITSEVAKKWRLGYSPDAWDGLIQHAAGKKFSAELLEAAGLALRREGGDGFYDRFRGRLMFSICDEQGRTVGFSGRILTDQKDQPKYVNSPETPIFQKGRILFALDKAKRAIIEETYAIVCEGQIDTISCHEAGIENVVAPQGTALTEQHIRILKRYCDDVVLMFDSDTAGKNAATRSLDSLLELATIGPWLGPEAAKAEAEKIPTSLLAAGMVIRVAPLPSGYDPDSFVKAFGADKLRELIAGAPSFFMYLLDRLCQQYDPRSDRGKIKIGEQLVNILSKIPNTILQATYARRVAERLNVPDEAILQEVRKLRLRQGARGSDTEAGADVETGQPRGLPEEEMLLQAMLANQQVIELVAGTLDVTWLSRSVAGETIQQVLKLHGAGQWNGPNSLLREGERGESEQLISELLLSRRTIKNPEREAPNCLMLLQRRWLEKQKHDNRRQQQTEGLAPDKMETLQKQFVDLDSKLRHIDALLRGE